MNKLIDSTMSNKYLRVYGTNKMLEIETVDTVENTLINLFEELLVKQGVWEIMKKYGVKIKEGL